MKLSEGRIGDLVVGRQIHWDVELIGFIVGITESCLKEPIFLVQFQNALTPVRVHPGNIEKYED